MEAMKQYLGDSVYANCDICSIILTTENGLPDDPSNTIIIDPTVLTAFLQYIKWVNIPSFNDVLKGE